MSKSKIQTIPNLADNSALHQEAIAAGEDHFRLWQRNVIDEFKSLPDEEIKAKLKQRAFPFAVCFENLINDFNIASGFRNANAMNAEAFYYIGTKKFDRRGMCGIHNYNNIEWLSTIDDLVSLKTKYTFVGVDNIDGAIPLDDYVWKPNSLIIFGSEGVGITPDMQKMCDEMVYVKQYGSIRSMNVAACSAIIMNDFVMKYNKTLKQ